EDHRSQRKAPRKRGFPFSRAGAVRPPDPVAGTQKEFPAGSRSREARTASILPFPGASASCRCRGRSCPRASAGPRVVFHGFLRPLTGLVIHGRERDPRVGQGQHAVAILKGLPTVGATMYALLLLALLSADPASDAMQAPVSATPAGQ